MMSRPLIRRWAAGAGKSPRSCMCVGTNDILQTYPYRSSVAACSAGVSPRVHGFFCRIPPPYPSGILVAFSSSFLSYQIGGLWRLQITPVRYFKRTALIQILFVPSMHPRPSVEFLLRPMRINVDERGGAETFTWSVHFLCATFRFFCPHLKRSSWVSGRSTSQPSEPVIFSPPLCEACCRMISRNISKSRLNANELAAENAE
ncbi:hypothetical protein F4680DRAFT_413749 [Xylaria scruposa]|nr:hypothetical protein F4680DRAFT_413749 [Xylaria scruposa]